jgi:membrane protein YdbS with pleckstrin-like domain
MGLLTAVAVFVVGFVSGTAVRWVAGLAAIVALVLVVLGVTPGPLPLVDAVLETYYVGNELLFLAGFLFGIDAGRTRQVVVERRAD